MVRQRVRIRFAKTGDLRLIGHRDLARNVERVFRRAGVPLGMSQGYHPKPRISFPSALAVGIEGLDEVMELELELEVPCSADALLDRLRPHLPLGLAFGAACWLRPGGKMKARLQSTTHQIAVPRKRRETAALRVAAVLACRYYPLCRPGREEPIDLHDFLEQLTLQDGVLTIRLDATRPGAPSPRDVLRAMELDDLERGDRDTDAVFLKRTRIGLQ